MVDSPCDWNEWLRVHGPALMLYARHWVPSVTEAEDAVHDGFVAFWKTRRRVADPLPYLFSCVRNAIRKSHRSRSRRQVRETVCASQTYDVSFECAVEHAERVQTVESALNRLNRDQRETIVLKIWGGLTLSQIGACIGISPNTAASRYRYGLKALRKLLETENARRSHGSSGT